MEKFVNLIKDKGLAYRLNLLIALGFFAHVIISGVVLLLVELGVLHIEGALLNAYFVGMIAPLMLSTFYNVFSPKNAELCKQVSVDIATFLRNKKGTN